MKKYLTYILIFLLSLTNTLTSSLLASPIASASLATEVNIQVTDTGQDLLSPPQLSADSAVLIDQESAKVLYGKSEQDLKYPASTTKILTALLAIEYGSLDDIVTVGEEISMIPWDSSKAYLEIGERISLNDLLYGLMLNSGNDAANTIAVYVARKVKGQGLSIEEALDYFSKMMNKRAKEAGAKNSNFVNAHGYHDNDHYTTALDMAMITRAAMEHDVFCKIVTTQTVQNAYCESGEPRRWRNTNRLIMENSDEYYEYATGTKTGYTGSAGNCLVSSANKDGLRLISVVLKAEPDKQWADSKGLLEYGFSNFTCTKLLEKGSIAETLPVVEYAEDDWGSLPLMVATDTQDQVIEKKLLPKIKKEIIWDEKVLADGNRPNSLPRIKAPVYKDQKVGEIQYLLEGEVIAKAPLVATREVKAMGFTEKPVTEEKSLLNYLVIIVFLISGYILLRLRISRLRRKRRRYYYLNNIGRQ